MEFTMKLAMTVLFVGVVLGVFAGAGTTLASSNKAKESWELVGVLGVCLAIIALLLSMFCQIVSIWSK